MSGINLHTSIGHSGFPDGHKVSSQFPTHTFRLAYDAMRGWKGERADVDYVRILHLAATTMECEVERALKRLLESRVRFDYAVVRQLSAPASPEIPTVELPDAVDLGVYDRLLAGGAR